MATVSASALTPRNVSKAGAELEDKDVSPERIAELADELSTNVEQAIKEISTVNEKTMLVSLNARIEAARAGDAGRAFGVVAQEVKKLSDKTAVVAEDMAEHTQAAIIELQKISRQMATDVRGVRLRDLALTNVDLCDRNLYERTCDVRWWATDSSLVDALSQQTQEAYEYASHRLGVILDSYTVYYDLVLADMNGEIIANGRPGRYHSKGNNIANAQWFREAVQTRSGAEYAFESAHRSELVNREPVLVYSCTVRERGDAHGAPLGVLGILFNWDALGQDVVEKTPLNAEDMAKTRCVITDDQLMPLADTAGQSLKTPLNIPGLKEMMDEKSNYQIVEIDRKQHCIAHAQAPGFETYSTGWHSWIIQEI